MKVKGKVKLMDEQDLKPNYYTVVRFSNKALKTVLQMNIVKLGYFQLLMEISLDYHIKDK